jgi:hypothetical protein
MIKYPSVIYDMPDSDYAKAPGIRCTLVKNYIASGSPYEFYMKNIHEDKPGFQCFNPTALELGKAVHGFVLEPENWERDFKVIPSDTRRGTIAYRKLLAENKGKTLIKESMFKDVKKIRDSVFKNKGAEKLLTKGKSEASVFWKEGNQAFKCRFDYLTDSGIVIDLKTCQDSNPRNFLKSIVNFNYDIQNVFYQRAAQKALGLSSPPPFVFIAVNKLYPFESSIIGLGEHTLKKARVRLEEALKNMTEHKQKDDWPSYGENLHVLEIEGRNGY